MHKEAFNKVHKQLIENNNLQMQKNTYEIHKYIENNRDPLNKRYNDDLIKLNELTKINSKSNKLLDASCKHFFNKKILNESILKNTNRKIKKKIK